MENCLIDYIGFQVCAGQDAPESNLYINTLPGISLESIDKIADAEQVTYLGVWNDAQLAAWPIFKQRFISEMLKCHELTRHCDYEDLICENKEFLATSWMYLLGYQLMIYRRYSDRLNRYTTVDLKMAEELSNFYLVEYENQLSLAVKLVDVSGCCDLKCSNNPQTVVWRP